MMGRAIADAVRAVALGVAVMGAAPSSYLDFSVPAPRKPAAKAPLPAPPKPPAPAPDFTPAPVPDIDLAAPAARDSGPPQPQFSPKVYGREQVYRGEGFLPGSAAQTEQERHNRFTPGMNITVPID
jgi:hypothetical protein